MDIVCFVCISFLGFGYAHKTNNKISSSKSSSSSVIKSSNIMTPKKFFNVERNIDIPDNVFPSDDEINKLEEPMPSSCQHGWFDSVYDNAKLHYRYWIPETKKPKAIAIFFHGISTHSGKSFLLKDGRKLNMALQAETLLKENIALYAPDMYGHGYSEGIRFYIPETWKNNMYDHINFINLIAKQQDNKDIPIFLIGESYGCTLTLHVAKYYQDNKDTEKDLTNLNSIILTAPAIIGDLPPYPVTKVLMILAKFYPTWRPFFMPNPISPKRIWRDPEVLAIRTSKRYKEMNIDGSGIPFRLGTALNLINALEVVRTETIPKLNVPFCIIHGTEDHGVPISGSEYLWEHAQTSDENKQFIRKEGAYHDLFSDYVAEECAQDVINWINQRLDQQKQKK